MQKNQNFYLGVDSFANKQTSITPFYPSGIHLEHPVTSRKHATSFNTLETPY